MNVTPGSSTCCSSCSSSSWRRCPSAEGHRHHLRWRRRARSKQWTPAARSSGVHCRPRHLGEQAGHHHSGRGDAPAAHLRAAQGEDDLHRGAGTLRYGDIVEVIDAAKGAGVREVRHRHEGCAPRHGVVGGLAAPDAPPGAATPERPTRLAAGPVPSYLRSRIPHRKGPRSSGARSHHPPAGHGGIPRRPGQPATAPVRARYETKGRPPGGGNGPFGHRSRAPRWGAQPAAN